MGRWGIEIGGDSDDDDAPGGQAPPAAPAAGEPLAEGLSRPDQGSAAVRPEDVVQEDEGVDLGDLMAQLKGVQG